MSTPTPILPVIDEDTAAFWAASREHRLVAQRCGACASFRFPPSPVCDRCGSWDHIWKDLPARGTLYSWVVARHAVVSAFADVPYVVGLVEFASGVRVPGRLRGVEPEDCMPGMALSVIFREVTPEVTLAEFVPAPSGGV